MEEPEHIKEVITTTLTALKNQDAVRLNQLSNQTIHTASCMQDPGSITLTVIIYTLSKLIERKDYEKIKNWPVFVKKISATLQLALKAVEQERYEVYENYLATARTSFVSLSVNLKPYIEEVLRKSSVNKASKIYEHGISLGQTAKLLGITPWEIQEYLGQKSIDLPQKSLDVKKRAKSAMEFFS